jgi:hypothetical protein
MCFGSAKHVVINKILTVEKGYWKMTKAIELKKYEPPLTEPMPLMLLLALSGIAITVCSVIYSAQFMWLLLIPGLLSIYKVSADNVKCESYRKAYHEYLNTVDFDSLCISIESLRNSDPEYASKFNTYIANRAIQKGIAS